MWETTRESAVCYSLQNRNFGEHEWNPLHFHFYARQVKDETCIRSVWMRLVQTNCLSNYLTGYPRSAVLLIITYNTMPNPQNHHHAAGKPQAKGFKAYGLPILKEWFLSLSSVWVIPKNLRVLSAFASNFNYPVQRQICLVQLINQPLTGINDLPCSGLGQELRLDILNSEKGMYGGEIIPAFTNLFWEFGK